MRAPSARGFVRVTNEWGITMLALVERRRTAGAGLRQP